MHRPEQRERGGEAEGHVGFGMAVGPLARRPDVVEFGLEAEAGSQHFLAEHGVAHCFDELEVELGVPAPCRFGLARVDEFAMRVLPDGFEQAIAALTAFGCLNHQ